VTLTVADSRGGISACSALVTVVDRTPPAIACPASLTMNNDPGLCSARVATGQARVTDNCPGATVSGSRGDGQPLDAPFSVGITEVVWTARDGSGNTAACAQTVTVRDVEPPVISDVTADPATLWPPNHRMVDVTVGYEVKDNCDRLEQLACGLQVRSNEPVDGTGDGDTAPDWEVRDAHRVQLRAERSGHGDGRVYGTDIACSDSKGNASAARTAVTVPKSQR
jgi:hypothetical protein